MKNKITLLNILSNLTLQILTIISGFVIPKIILSNFGSEINGLVSSINQFLGYISLVEGGVSGVIIASLYKPIIDNDYKRISSIYKTAKSFYKKISLILIIYSLFIAILYPLLFENNFNFIYIFLLVIILSIGLLNQYTFSLAMKTLLIAKKNGYVVYVTNSFVVCLTMLFSILSVKIFPSIHILKFISGILYLIQPIFYGLYIKKNYKLQNDAKEDNNLIKNRWDGFAINIASFVHNGTDIVLLTIFTNLKTVSIYSIYILVLNGLSTIITSISSAMDPTLGQIYASGNHKRINEKMEQYELIIFTIVFILFTVGSILIVPFVMIYTKGINDTNYYQPQFGILLLIAQAIHLLKSAHLGLAYSANKFKEIKNACYIEALLNIVISCILINRFGLIGVSIGTIIAMLYRTIYQVYFTSKFLITDRKQYLFYKKIILFVIFAVIGVFICNKFTIGKGYNIYSFITNGIIYTLIMIILYITLLLIFYRKDTLKIIDYLLKI